MPFETDTNGIFGIQRHDAVIKLNAAYAERASRRISHEIWGCDTMQDLRNLWLVNGELLDAMQSDFPEFYEIVAEEFRAYGMTPEMAHASTALPCRPTERNTMANNPDFLKVVVKDVTLQWPRLDQTYRYNSQKKETEACAPTVQGAGYSISWLMDKGDAKALHDKLRAHYEDCKARNSKLPDFGTVFGMKKTEDGNFQFTAKRKAVSNAGTENKPPKVIGPDLQPLADPAIWTGSTGNIRLSAFPTTDPDGQGGISFGFDAVQVIEAVYGSDNLEDDFGPATGGSIDDFDDEPAPKPKAQAPAPADDDIFA